MDDTAEITITLTYTHENLPMEDIQWALTRIQYLIELGIWANDPTAARDDLPIGTRVPLRASSRLKEDPKVVSMAYGSPITTKFEVPTAAVRSFFTEIKDLLWELGVALIMPGYVGQRLLNHRDRQLLEDAVRHTELELAHAKLQLELREAHQELDDDVAQLGSEPPTANPQLRQIQANENAILVAKDIFKRFPPQDMDV